jgi:peroxin-16
MLGVTRRPLLNSPIPGREVDPSLLPSKTPRPDPLAADLEESLPDLPNIPALPPAPLHSHILPLSDALPEPLQSPAQELLPRLRGTKEWIGETMHATEGLVCVLTYIWVAHRQQRQGLRPGRGAISPTVPASWGLANLAQSTTTTSLVPLIYILVSRLLRRQPRRGDEGMTSLLADTYAERDSNLVWYLVRGSIWQRFTRPKAMGLLKALDKVWGLNLIATLVKDHVDLVDDLYYCEPWEAFEVMSTKR